MSEILHKATQKLIEDPIFLKIIETKIKSIMNDGKIDKNDIPDIILLLVYCTNNLKKFNLSYNELSNVLEETVLYILNHFDVIPDDKKDEFMEMIQTMIKLVMLQPKVKSCLLKLKCW
jgi:hypothetical protein